MKSMVANGVRGALTLLVFTTLFTALMAGTYAATKSIVDKNTADAERALIAQVLPAGSYDNNLLADKLTLSLADARTLGNDEPSSIYLAKHAGKETGAVVETTAPDGYAGRIKLLVGIAPDGRVLGVRVVQHKETPGLGDYIDAAKSNWSEQFTGKSLGNPKLDGWKVKKDGGAFDSNAGATISPRAVVKAVSKVLVYVSAHKAQVFGEAA
ncbi:electron transport complex subunit RsxG [Amantichitinum ursilacus]|uniref:Ion-translocating oxidoreductase complex subunit G n=1 Tax=Amantichitinum ursilacus TaxID=857265 RepID=A0A0N0GP34_9NEIS|nr:electron transport complex subunit RsxG [Amantichitinum ursilacus]KPC53415.1 Electron transport complex protein RnfG [Amantichitinum ursilacus]